MSKDIRQFLQLVKEAGQNFYVEVKRPLNPQFEKDVLQLKLAHEGRFPVIYCPEIMGSNLPLVSNLFGSYKLLGLALDMDPTVATKSDILREFRNRESGTRPVQTVPGSEAPVKEVILRDQDVDLGILPCNLHAPLNSGKFITAGQMVCKDPDTGIRNVGIYRFEVKGKNQLGAMLIAEHHAGYIARRYAELDRPMEVAIFLGHHPAVAFGSVHGGSIDVDELELMGGLLKESFRVTKGESVDLPVPADAEIVIEGTIDSSKMVTDGPFSEWEGYYGLEIPCYLIQVNCLTMRRDAIYHDLAPSQREHNLLSAPGQTSVVYNAVRTVVPTVKEVYLPFSGRSILIAYVSINKRVAGEANRAALAALSSRGTLKLAVIVDDDVDVYNEEEVIWAIATRARLDTDIVVIPRVLGDPLSPVSYDETDHKRGQMISKMIIDATKPVEVPFAARVIPPQDLWNSVKLEDYLK